MKLGVEEIMTFKNTFLVYVVESPSAPDVYHRRSEGNVIANTLELQGIPCVVRTAVTKEAFQAALYLGLSEELQKHQNLIPILHISAHGNKEGIQLSNTEVISWSELRTLLHPINTVLQNCLVLCMSCCHGYFGSQMAMFLEDPNPPFLVLIGNNGKPTWAETAIAYGTFYHLLTKGSKISEALDAMCIASGNNEFLMTTGQDARIGYTEYIEKLNPERISAQLQETTRHNAPNNIDQLKALEKN